MSFPHPLIPTTLSSWISEIYMKVSESDHNADLLTGCREKKSKLCLILKQIVWDKKWIVRVILQEIYFASHSDKSNIEFFLSYIPFLSSYQYEIFPVMINLLWDFTSVDLFMLLTEVYALF